MTEVKESKTIFVRNLPYSVKTDELEDKFSEYGPINQCFVVNDRETGKSRGFGYVKFTSFEDAKKAEECEVSLQGRKLSTSFADISRKIRGGPRKQKEKKETVGDNDDGGDTFKEKTEEDMQHKDIKPGKGKLLQSVQPSKRKMEPSKQKMEPSKQNIERPIDIQKKFRVIVRNLSFQCTDSQLKNAFLHCGEITEVKIPTSSDGKKLGFGFLQFSKLPYAKKAVKEMNSKKILGRAVAVDWTLPKDRYEKAQQENGNIKDKSLDSGIEMPELEKDTGKQKPVKEELHPDSDSGDDSDGDDSDGDGDDNSDESDDEKNDVVEGKESSDSDESDSREDEEGTSDSEANDDDDDESGDEKVKRNTKKKVSTKSDTDDGCTLFLRNLSFDTTEEGLEEFFEQYGDIEYAKVVYNRDTEHSKGIGFVRFSSKSAAEQCLAAAAEGQISLDGRELIIAIAVSREKAHGFNEKKEKEKKDNRNLYLAGEGVIRAGTQAAEGLSKVDLDKRMKVEELKRKKLKNLNIFISPVRLCVRNIPVTVDDKSLRETFKSAAGDKTAQIVECRIMRDRARTNAEGTGKSMGFGFVRFSEHQHALAALKKANNNPELFGDKKRLIVEFSLENRKALEAKESRKEKVKAKMLSKQQGGKSAQVKRGAKTPNLPLLELSEKDKKLKGDKVHKGLPSHWGPKIRHKPRPSQLVSAKKTKKNKQQKQPQTGQKRKESQQMSEGPVQKKRKPAKKNETFDDFDKIVNKYKNKLTGRKDRGWFE